MSIYRQRILVLLLLLLRCQLLPAEEGTSVFLPDNWKEKGYVLQLKDELQHPDLSWPVTLLQYKLHFGAAGTPVNQFTVINEATGQPVPFQLAAIKENKGKMLEATLYLLSDLPAGAQRRFRLLAKAGIHPSPVNSVQVVRSQEFIELSNGLIRLQLPVGTSRAPKAPVLRFGNGSQWLGNGELPNAFKRAHMQVEAVETGALITSYRISYTFSNSKVYTINIRLSAAMEFAELEESMNGFQPADSLSWQLVWNGLQPAVRYASTRTGIAMKTNSGNQSAPYYHGFLREPMDGYPDSLLTDKHPYQSNDQRNDSTGRLPFHLALYDNWMTWWRLPTAAFWNEQTDAVTIGLFIKEAEKWNDEQYPLWGSKEPLSIKYHWKNNTLDYHFPLVQGTRSVALAAYPHSKDIAGMNAAKKPLAYIEYLRRYYGWISLNKTKDWVLNYEGNDGVQPKYFDAAHAGNKLSLNWLQQSLQNMVTSVATGAERNFGPTPVGARVFYESIAPSFDIHRASMEPTQYKKLRAWFLFMSYVFMDEGLMPMRTMLGGHPNFLMDIKVVPGLSAFLFPGHPQAQQMAQHFEKSLQLNDHYHIRPAVNAWNTQGGRWTENLSTYTWAALRPALRTNFLLHHHYDQKNRLLQPGISELGNWLLNAMTAPRQQSGRRGFPPQGAHAQDFSAGSPDLLRLLAQELVYYDPLLAEHMFWATDSTDKAFEGDREIAPVWKDVLSGTWAANKGTQPHLHTAKFTGYGIVLRSRFAQPDEMYVHLQQIDEGPNYRWGRAASGGNGVIYYYANGKRYSFNGPEDVGDGPFGDVERCTNFGVKLSPGYRQHGTYRSIGRGNLTAPLYDFGFAQSATLYAHPSIANTYRSRSILQSGADYIAVFDDVANNSTESRFSWFTGREDDFPFIYQLTPGVSFTDADLRPSQSSYHKDPAVLPTKGRYYDGKGDFLTIVTHLPNTKVARTTYGAQVQLRDGTTDHVFRSDTIVRYKQNGLVFAGTSGIIKEIAPGQFQGALFDGSELGAGPLRIQMDTGGNTGISFQPVNGGYKGKCQTITDKYIRFYLDGDGKSGLHFFIDGMPVVPQQADNGAIIISFPAGEHHWQWSSTNVIPGIPIITGTSNKSGGFSLHWTGVPGAASYQVQLSKDNGASWRAVAGAIQDTTTLVEGLMNHTKVHCRIIANGNDVQGNASAAYPVYINADPPHCPEGLQAMLQNSVVSIQWGQILGALQYNLYRRVKSAKDTSWQLLYSGPQRAWLHTLPPNAPVYEYTVTAVNGNGESSRSVMCDTDPASILNWYPPRYYRFRRDTESHENGFPEYDPFREDTMPILNYPD